MKLCDYSGTHEETRNRVIQAAGEVFAEIGFERATVREICARAEANIAAVNYHFGDKVGLYSEVLKEAVRKNQQDVIADVQDIADPEQALRSFVGSMLSKMCKAERPHWHVRAMMHEMAQPTPALNEVVQHVIRPNSRVFCAIVGKLLNRPPDDEVTRLCAASIIGQVMHQIHAGPVIATLWPDLKVGPETLERIANHIADFSLAGLKQFRVPGGSAKPARRRSK
jgi:AcrR family transcriptional regulator